VDCSEVRSAGGRRDTAVLSSMVVHNRHNNRLNQDSAGGNSYNCLHRFESIECYN